MSRRQRQQVVIIGGGFGGLKAAESMAFAPVDVTLIDRGGEHLFQPLLYQVATGNLAAEDVTAPLAGVLDRQRNASVVTGEVVDIDVSAREVSLKDGQIFPYDTLIVATGAGNHYYGRDDEWAALAPSLKTMEDAREMRARIWRAFRAADAEPDLATRRGLQTFVIVGGGPTGVELAGALGELAHRTLRGEFNNCDTAESEIILLEGLDRVLNGYPAELSAAAEQSLEELGVTVRTGTLVTDITDDYVVVRDVATDEQTLIPTATVLWAAGVKASPLADVVAAQTGARQDRMDRLMVQPDLTLPDYPDLFVIGDLAHLAGPDGKPLPGVAQVAMQQGDYVADVLRRRRFGRTIRPFHLPRPRQSGRHRPQRCRGRHRPTRVCRAACLDAVGICPCLLPGGVRRQAEGDEPLGMELLHAPAGRHAGAGCGGARGGRGEDDGRRSARPHCLSKLISHQVDEP